MNARIIPVANLVPTCSGRVGSEASAAAVRENAGIAASASIRPRLLLANWFSARVMASEIRPRTRRSSSSQEVSSGRGSGSSRGPTSSQVMSIGVLSVAVMTISSVNAGSWSVG